MARKSRNTDGNFAPELSVRDTDVKYTGGEPLFTEQPTPEARKGAIVAALNWYSRFFDRKMAKELILEFAVARGVGNADMRVLRSVPDREYDMSLAWLSRLALRGLVLTDAELARIGDHLRGRITARVAVVEEVAEEVKPSNRPNVQELMRERAREAAGEIEGLFDGFLLNGDPDPASVNVVGILTERGILPQHTSDIVVRWRARRAELETVQDGKDALLKEGYSQYGKIAIRNMIKFCDSVIAGVGSYINVKRASKTPRKRRAVPVERVVAKVKYAKTYSDANLKLNLTSIPPTKIVGATEVWAYDTAKRKLHYYVADSHVGTLGVKGASITGYDTAASGMKTLRKPAETLKALLNAGKPAARKLFKEIKAVHANVKGRTNENLVILRAQ